MTRRTSAKRAAHVKFVVRHFQSDKIKVLKVCVSIAVSILLANIFYAVTAGFDVESYVAGDLDADYIFAKEALNMPGRTAAEKRYPTSSAGTTAARNRILFCLRISFLISFFVIPLVESFPIMRSWCRTIFTGKPVRIGNSAGWIRGRR